MNYPRPRWFWRLVITAERRWNHPYALPWPGQPDTHWGPRSTRLCDLVDRLTSNWCHD